MPLLYRETFFPFLPPFLPYIIPPVPTKKSRPYSTCRGGKVGLKFTVSLRFQNVKQTQQKIAQARSIFSFAISFPSYCVPCVTHSPKLVFCQPHSVSHHLAFLHLPFLFPFPFPSVYILSELRPFGKDTSPVRGSSPVGPKKLHDNVKIKRKIKSEKALGNIRLFRFFAISIKMVHLQGLEPWTH